MAIIRPGALAAATSGSVGGLTFASTRNGALVRSRPSKVNAQSIPQMASRARLSRAQNAWLALTAVQKTAWNNAAAVKFYPNKLGVQRHLTGHQMFLKQALIYIALGLAIPTYPQTMLTTPYMAQTFFLSVPGLYNTSGYIAPPVPYPVKYSCSCVITPNANRPADATFLSGPIFTQAGFLEDHTADFTPIYGPTQPGKYLHGYITATKDAYLPSAPFYSYAVFA